MNTTPKNLVVCLDGTANEFGKENTNVVRLYQTLVSDPATQVCYYDPGVGTMGHPGAITRLAQKITQVMGLAFGLGVTQNVIDAYQFLMAHYADGDRIYIFGFSRGALEARALAGLLFRCGLLAPELSTLVPYAVRVYQGIDKDELAARDPVALEKTVSGQFKATFSREVRVHFLGLWDTVTAFGNIWSPIYWPFTTNNHGVDTVRHAIALDERRAFFRQNRWAQGDGTHDQNVRERWFVGVHCDVGGGYAPAESALWKVTMKWMADEAVQRGLRFEDARLKALLEDPATGGHGAADDLAPLHDSMPGLGPVWYIAECVPTRRHVRKEGKYTREWLWPVGDWFVPWLRGQGKPGRARILIQGDRLHRSVLERYVADPKYRPDSLAPLRLTPEAAAKFLAGPEESYEVSDLSGA